LRKELNEIKEMLRSQTNNSSQVPLSFVNYPFGYFIPFGQFSQNNNHSQYDLNLIEASKNIK
jgi:hypothetical protein